MVEQTKPERVWLDLHRDPYGYQLIGLSWEQPLEFGTEYVRADSVAALVERVAELENALMARWVKLDETLKGE